MLAIRAIPVCLLLVLLQTAPLFAADPVEISVSGVEGDPLENVRRALTLPHGLVREGEVDRLWLERFAQQAPEKVRTALEPFGYYRSEVSVRAVQPGEGEYRLQVTVLPGEQTRVAGVDLELEGAGAGEKSLRRLKQDFPLKQGEVLLHPAYEGGKGQLQSEAQNLGYLDAEFSRHQILIAPDLATAQIVLTLDTGPRYRFGETRIEGAPDYPDPFLSRFLAYREGEPFSYAKLGETQLNLANSERFRQVMVTPQREQAEDAHVPILVRLTAAPRRTLRTGVGYGTDTGTRFSANFRDLNLFHRGHDLDLSLYIAQRLQGFAGRYTVPSMSDHRSYSAVQLNLQQEDVTSYVSKIAMVELNRTIGLGRGELGTAYVRLLQESFKIAEESSNSRLVLPGFRFTKDAFNDLVRPTRGYRYSLDLRGAHPYLGSDSGLAQFIAHTNVLVPLPWRLNLQARANGAYSLLDDPFAELPPSIRFFAGGDQSVRGYTYQSLGPRSPSGRVLGGKHLLVGSLELERSLFQKWGVSIFHDIGNAFNDYNSMHLERSVGVGVHYYTPVGGLNLYLAHPFASGAPFYRIHFTVGFQL